MPSNQPQIGKLSADELNKWLAELAPHLTCWKLGLYYGSVVYMEMGDKVPTLTYRGEPDVKGAANLALLADYWVIRHHEQKLAQADTITREYAETFLAPKFIGQRPRYVEVADQALLASIHFTGDLAIDLWLSRQDPLQEDDELFNLFLPDGRIVIYDVDHKLHLSEEISERTAAHWRKRISN